MEVARAYRSQIAEQEGDCMCSASTLLCGAKSTPCSQPSLHPRPQGSRVLPRPHRLYVERTDPRARARGRGGHPKVEGAHRAHQLGDRSQDVARDFSRGQGRFWGGGSQGRDSGERGRKGRRLGNKGWTDRSSQPTSLDPTPPHLTHTRPRGRSARSMAPTEGGTRATAPIPSTARHARSTSSSRPRPSLSARSP